MWDHEQIISMICLVITGTACTWGVFSNHFDDNVLQRLGLSIVAIGCGARFAERLMYDVPAPPPALLWSQIGLALYAAGTVLRFWIASTQYGSRRRTHGRRGLHY